MGDAFHIVRYNKSDRGMVFNFLREVYSQSRSERLIQQWDWKYDGNPFNRQADPYIFLLKKGSNIVGMHGAIYLCVSVSGREHWITGAGDMVVHSRYRRHGLSRQMINEYMAESHMNFGWLNSVSRRAMTKKYSSSSASISPLIKLLNISQILQTTFGRKYRKQVYGITTSHANSKTLLLKRRSLSSRISVNKAQDFDGRVDELFEHTRKKFPVILVRDSPYLTWRFIGRPDAKYTLLFATEADNLLGYLVFRSTERDGLKIGYLVDFLVDGNSSHILTVLVQEAAVLLREEGAGIISCRATALSYRNIFYGMGFFPWYFGPPCYFNPRINSPDPTLRSFGNAKDWYLTMGDGDLEMDF